MNTWDKAPDITIHNEREIRGFFDEYRWLSNFFPCRVESVATGLVYPSAENAYQAAKCPISERLPFTKVSAAASKKMGKAGKRFSSDEWNDKKEMIMRTIVLTKFLQNPELGQKLIDTGDRYLEETNWWGDVYWGVCRGTGENTLGRILMDVREVIKKQK